MSDQEILSYLTNKENKTCGLFLESQLKTYSIPNNKKTSKIATTFASHFFNLSLLSLLSFNAAFSQDKRVVNEIVKIDSQNQNTIQDSTKINKKISVEGIVSDPKGPLPGAYIYLKGTTISAQTDLDGKFKFPIPLKINDVLVVSFIGYNNKEVLIKDTGNNVKLEIDIKLKGSDIVLLGEVSTDKVYTSKKTFFQKLKSIFTNE
ncbi:carboxypeptidase-like regulatory domain-containing protein [Flavobacterium sp.]